MFRIAQTTTAAGVKLRLIAFVCMIIILSVLLIVVSHNPSFFRLCPFSALFSRVLTFHLSVTEKSALEFSAFLDS